MAEALQHLEQRTRDCEPALHRLISVGVDPERDRAAAVARFTQGCLEQRRGVGFAEQAGFEIEARRQAEIGMRRARETVDAAMLATAVGIDRAVEGYVRRFVVNQYAARTVALDLGRRPFVLGGSFPAVVEGLVRARLEAPADVADRAAPLDLSRR